jgi:phage minor structural protein
MIKIFSPTDKSFSSNGDIVLRPLKAKVHKEDNGDYYLDLETGLDYVDYLVEGNIVVASTPQGDQAFRITNPTKTKSKITVKAWHVFYDSENYLIEDSYVVDKNCNDALDHLNSATTPQSPFITISDVGTANSFRCVRKSLYEAISTVIERWGGHLVRNNFTIEVRSNIGQDNGVTVQYKKNLKDITCEENWDKVVTQLLPVGKDGILLNAIDESASLYVVSEIQYAIPYTKTVSFSQENVLEEDYKDGSGNTDEMAYKQALVDDLMQQAQEYVDANCYPEVNYTLKANLEKITDVGDTIEVKDDRLGLDMMTNVIAFDYDCILGQYTEIEFGNFKNSLSGLVSNITASVNKDVTDQVQNAIGVMDSSLQQATDQILGVMGDSYVIYNGDMILVLDALPKESAQNVIMINNGGIGFSQTGINGTFKSAWTIDGTLNMQNINVINLIADMIKGGTLKLGSHLNVSGILELYDDVNNVVGQMDRNGLKMFGVDGSYVVMNDDVGFAGYDRNDNKIYWVSGEEFHMKKSVVEEEITLCNQLRFIPIQITENGTVVNEGIGLVSAFTGGN